MLLFGQKGQSRVAFPSASTPVLKISLSVKKNSTKTSNKIIIIKQHYSYNSRKNYTFKTFPYFSWHFNKNNVNFICKMKFHNLYLQCKL